MTPPNAPRRLSWAIAARVAGRVLAGLALTWLAALVAWPERHDFMFFGYDWDSVGAHSWIESLDPAHRRGRCFVIRRKHRACSEDSRGTDLLVLYRREAGLRVVTDHLR